MPFKPMAQIIILEEDPLGLGDNSNPRYRVHLGVDKNRIRYKFKGDLGPNLVKEQ